MSRTHLRASTSAFVVLVAVAGAIFVTTAAAGDAQSTAKVATAAAPVDPATENPADAAPPIDGERVLADAQRQQALATYTEILRAGEAEQAAAQQAAALEALARAEREAQAGIPDSFWDRMAQCETGGNWSMVGSRYSGGLGFYNGTWDSFGGREFAARAGQATREQQIVVANRVANGVGLSGWGCLSHVGRP